jgi:uncharacterized YigZ family protein
LTENIIPSLHQQVFKFKTIQSETEALYKEKGSKFLAFAFPVETEEQIRDKLLLLRKKYYDARHHCYAWALGPEKKQFRAFDDGEPNHSAGDPILGQIRSREVTNILIVVVRYFGGVKLGVGGLISAYRMAAGLAMDNAIIVDEEIAGTLTIDYAYESTPEVMRLVKDFELKPKHQEFRDRCVIEVSFPMRLQTTLIEKLNLLRDTGTSLHWDDTSETAGAGSD